MKSVAVERDVVEHIIQELAIPLISVSTMPRVTNEEDDAEMNEPLSEQEYSDEAVQFDTETHIQQLEEVSNIYNIDMHEWALCSIVDNCRLNKKIARLLGISHVGCLNHKLNLGVKAMIASDFMLSPIIDSIHSTMLNCLQKLKNRAMLRNLTEISPIIHNKTRWSSKYSMLKHFNRIRHHFRRVLYLKFTAVLHSRIKQSNAKECSNP